MYKKIEKYNWCDIYKHINAGVYISAFNGKKIARGSYMDVKNAVCDFLIRVTAYYRAKKHC